MLKIEANAPTVEIVPVVDGTDRVLTPVDIPSREEISKSKGEINVNVGSSSKKSVCTGFKEACAELSCLKKTENSCVMGARCLIYYGLQLAAATAVSMSVGHEHGPIGYTVGAIFSVGGLVVINAGIKCIADRGVSKPQGCMPMPNDFQNWLPCYKKV